MAKITASTVINTHIEEVWQIIRGFNSLPEWHPAITKSFIEDNAPEDKVGCIRNFIFNKKSTIREQLLALSDINYYCTYSILESPMQIENYVSTIRLLPITDKSWCYAEWTASFSCMKEDNDKLCELIKKEVFYTGFDGIKRKLNLL